MGEGGNEEGEGLHAGELSKYANILEVVEAGFLLSQQGVTSTESENTRMNPVMLSWN